MLVCKEKANRLSIHLVGNVLAEAVTISVVQLLRKVMWWLLSTHVVDSPARRGKLAEHPCPTQVQQDQYQLTLTCTASYTAQR